MRNFRSLVVLLLLTTAFIAEAAQSLVLVPKWERFEREFKSTKSYANSLNDVTVAVVFTSPSGESRSVNAFWDGGKSWKVRFSPNEVGKWLYTAVCSDSANKGLEEKSGTFTCTAAVNKNRFSKHGPIQVSGDGRFFHHEDGTPFFWLADTAWNGPLLSSSDQWRHYIDIRLRQGFTGVQWVGTQWRAAPDGNRFKQLGFTGRDKIHVNPTFFQDLDRKHDALNDAGLLSVPVLLWAIGGGTNPKVNPGLDLPEDQAILLAKYMVARWGANDVAWFLGGDGDYRGDKAEKWRRIGRAVFGHGAHAPVTMHPGGMHWVQNDFQGEKWMDYLGYQSGHGDDENTLKWLISGPPATDWAKRPYRPYINLEPPYENHLAYQSKQPISPHIVRRATWWSLLVAPTAGVSYGGHGVWGWDDGTQPPVDHPGSGTPAAWSEAIRMPGAEQMRHVASLFNSISFWRLRPAPKLVAQNSGAAQFIAAAKSIDNDTAVIYTPAGGSVNVNAAEMQKNSQATWFNPRTGQRTPAQGQNGAYQTPDNHDWVLLLRGAR